MNEWIKIAIVAAGTSVLTTILVFATHYLFLPFCV